MSELDPFQGYRPNLFPRLSHVARCLGGFVTQHHEIPNTGGAVMLDEALDDETVIIPESTQLMLDYSTNEP